MAGLGIFELPIFANVVLPFVLMFVIVFAILEKTEILGKGKRQINAIVSFIFSLMFIALPGAVGVAQNMIPVIGVVIIILLSFMMLYGFAGGEPQKNTGLKITFGILIGITMIVTILWATGKLPAFGNFFSGENVASTAILVVFIIAIFSVVLSTGGKPGESGNKGPHS